MQAVKRQLFLDSYFEMLGGHGIVWTKIEADKIYGTVIYDPNDPEEIQDFCWHCSEEEVPSDKALELTKILTENKFISIDKLIVPIQTVFEKSNETDFTVFNSTMNELFNVEVFMVDDGEETCSYFIHD